MRFQYYLLVFYGSVFPNSYKLFKVFLPELSHNTGLFAELYLFTLVLKLHFEPLFT